MAIRRPEMNIDCCSRTHGPACRCPRSMSSQDNQQFFTEWEETYDSFDQMGLHENLLRGIYAYGEGQGPSPAGALDSSRAQTG